MKRIYIDSLNEGAKIDDVFLVASKSVLKTRDGKPFLKLKLADKTGQIDAVRWGASDTEISAFDENDYAIVYGSVNTYNGSLQLTLDSCRKHHGDIDPADFIRCSERDPKEMLSELREIVRSITNPTLSKLLNHFFANTEFARTFSQAPAAKSVHHAYVGGLIEHTLNVTRTCMALAELYPNVNRDLMVTGAILHDIGKVEEFVWSGAITYSEAGHFIGHVVGGAMMVKQAANSIKGFDPVLSLTLQHIVISHHGTTEFGSPKPPQCIEAMLINHADDLDAKVAIFETAISESEENGYFTKNNYFLNRPVFKGLRDEIIAKDTVTPSQPKSANEGGLDLFAVEGRDLFSDK